MDTNSSLKLLLKKALPMLAAAIFATATSATFATPFPNPFPVDFEDDFDGTGLFIAGDGSFAVELADTFDGFSSFGFFDIADPGTLISIFDTTDSVGEAAIIDFDAGSVFDVEDGAIQNLFASPVSVMGFYMDIGGTQFFSVPELNIGGLDIMATHESIATPGDFSMLFYSAPAGIAGVPSEVLGWQYMTGLTPVATEMPVPATTALLLIGLLGLRMQRTRIA